MARNEVTVLDGEEGQRLRLIRLSDDKFAKRVMGKYGWSIGQSSNRRGLLIYRTEPKHGQFTSTPMHIDVHIRSIRSMLHMHALTINQQSHQERVVERTSRNLRQTWRETKERVILQPQAVEQSAPRTTNNREMSEVTPSKFVNRQKQQVDQTQLHVDYNEVFHNYQSQQGELTRDYVYNTINQANLWIRNQSWWRSMTARQLIAHALISKDNAIRHMDGRDHMQSRSTLGNQYQIEWKRQSNASVVIVNRKQAAQEQRLLRDYALIQQMRQFIPSNREPLDARISQPRASDRFESSPRMEDNRHRLARSTVNGQSVLSPSPDIGRRTVAVVSRPNMIVSQAQTSTNNQEQWYNQPSVDSTLPIGPRVQRVTGVQSGLPPIYAYASRNGQYLSSSQSQSALPSMVDNTGHTAPYRNAILIPRSALIHHKLQESIQTRRMQRQRNEGSQSPPSSQRSNIAGESAAIQRTAHHVQVVVRHGNVVTPRSATEVLRIDQPARSHPSPLSQSQRNHNDSYGQEQGGARSDGSMSDNMNVPIRQASVTQAQLLNQVLRHMPLIEPPPANIRHISNSMLQRADGQAAASPVADAFRWSAHRITGNPIRMINRTAGVSSPAVHKSNRMAQQLSLDRTTDQSMSMLAQSQQMIRNELSESSAPRAASVIITRRTVEERRASLDQSVRPYDQHQSTVQQRIVQQHRSAEQRQPGSRQQLLVQPSTAPTIQANQKRSLLEQTPMAHIATSSATQPPAAQAQPTTTPQSQVQQVIEQQINTQQVTNHTETHIHMDSLGGIARSRAVTQSFVRQLTERTIHRRTNQSRLINRTQARTMTMMNRVNQLHATTVTTHRQLAGSLPTDQHTTQAQAAIAPDAMLPLIQRSQRSATAGPEQPAALTRAPVRAEPVRLEVPARRVTEQSNQEPVIRSLEHAIKSVEQELNQAKEQWAKPSLSINQLADQMYKEFSRRIRHEQQRRGL